MVHTSINRVRPRRFVFAAAFAALVLALGIAPVSSAASTVPATPGGNEQDFAAQAREWGLTDAQANALQDRVENYLAKTGGTQVAANRIQLEGADIVLALPEERTDRDLGARAAVFGCQYGHLCAFSGPYFEGDVIDMYHCGIYPIPHPGVGSGSIRNC